MPDAPSTISSTTRGGIVLSGVLVIAVAITGAVRHHGGHPVPSHPWAEISLGMVGVTNVFLGLTLGKGRHLVGRVALAAATGVSTLIWAWSAFQVG